MLFNSMHFLIYFPIVVLVYFLMPRKCKEVWLLLASYYFYMCWNAKYAILIFASTFTTYVCALFYEKYRTNLIRRRSVLMLGILFNLSILFLYKYSGFLINNLNRFLSILHVSSSIPTFSLVLPVGISFYTFQALGYLFDVVKNDVKAERNFVRYALFVSFFPQLVAGPIERSKNLLSQIQNIQLCKKVSYEQIVHGLTMMLWGMFMKIVIADRLAIFVDGVFASKTILGTFEIGLAVVGFAIQIYCDFNGYSTIASGAAKIMGFELMDNFETPYFARSIKEFWRRWHISLSTWFKDYVYIPLGGNRCASWRVKLNLMITFLVSGLWHGARWNFVFWGFLHGFYQVVGQILMPLRIRVKQFLQVNEDSTVYQWFQRTVVFFLVCVAWLFFRSYSMSRALDYLILFFTNFNPWVLVDESIFNFGLDVFEIGLLIVSLFVLFVFDKRRYDEGTPADVLILRQPIYFRWPILLSLLLFVLVFGIYGPGFDEASFIYFQF